MSKKMYPVIHFEMPAKDDKRVREFYESVFGWQITQLGPDTGDFQLAFTTETDTENRMPKKPGAIKAVFTKEPGRMSKPRSRSWWMIFERS